MKKLLYILTPIFFLFLSSCQLVGVLDVEPPNNLVPDNVVKDAESAENLLNGVYASFNNQYNYMYTETTPGLLSGSMSRNGFLANIDIANNSILIENADAAAYWKAFYEQIDAANSVIKLIPNVADEGFGGNRKQE